METFIEIIKYVDWIAFIIMLIPVAYFTNFGILSLFPLIKKRAVSKNSQPRKILVIFPAYKEDKVIINSIESFLQQDYPKDRYKVCVVSDQMSEKTNSTLSALPIQLLIPNFEKSLKAKALQYAVSSNSNENFEIVTILDADNIVGRDYLQRINSAFDDYKAVQCHRKAKNTNTPTSVLDAVSEEIANSIFRKGHRNLGFSSALIGSGMAFDFDWFSKNVPLLKTSGEDKEIERLLLKDRIKIDYLEDVAIFDEKTQKGSDFYNQRRRWIATRFFSLFRNIKEMIPALFRCNIDYCDKLFQWLLPSRVITVGITLLVALSATFVRFDYALKWWILSAVLIIVLCLCIPRSLWNKKLLKAIINIPLMMLMMVANLFRLKGAEKTFIHTEKGYSTEKRIKIAIEAQHIFQKQKHGMDMVVLECIRELQKIDHNKEYYIMVAPGEDRCFKESENFHIIEVNGHFHPLWEQFSLPLALRKIKPDFLHCTSNTAPVFSPYPLILTLHDIIFLEKKWGTSKSKYQRMGRIYRRLVVPLIVPKAKKIITVSDYELENIRKKLRVPADKIVRIYNGMSDRFYHSDKYAEVTSKYFPDKLYIFFLGNTDPKKNAQRTLEAYSLYASRCNNPLPLVVADLGREIVEEMLTSNCIDLSIMDNIRITGYISNFDLPSIYSGASLFLYPSLRESFGIPVLESMACKTPVITSSTSALPEIVQNAAYLVDPENVEEIAEAIEKVEKDENLRNFLIEEGLHRHKHFTWHNTAIETKKLYDSLENQKNG